MAVRLDTPERRGLIPREEYLANAREEAERDREPDSKIELTEEERDRYKIIDYCANLFEQARKAREPFETFDTAWALFVGNTFPAGWPNYRAKITINKIRALITFMQAIMTDSKPRLYVDPVLPGSEDAADLLGKITDRDWDENEMQDKLSLFVQHGLIWGNGVVKIAYDPYANGGRGKHTADVIEPYNIYTNRTATSVEDCEYIIHVEKRSMGWVRRHYPEKAKAVSLVRGTSPYQDREGDRDYIREGDDNQRPRIITAQNINGNITPPTYSQVSTFFNDESDEVEIAEFWFRDDTREEYQRQKYQDGQPQYEPETDDDGNPVMEVVGQRAAISEIDGSMFLAQVRKPKMKPVMESAWRMVYPNGRLAIIAGGTILLRDIANPFQTDGFPFAIWKDYDSGNFWGTGECLALRDCQVGLNRIASEIYNILQKVGNPSYKLLKGAGVNAQTIKNKPGFIIPMDDMKALEPLEKPQMPGEFFQLFELINHGMGTVAGVTDAAMGAMPAANTSFATVDSLQESNAAPIRLKVRNMERGLKRMGRLRVALIQQFDNGQRPIRVPDNDKNGTPQPAENTRTQFRNYSRSDLQGQVEFGMVPISSLSTSPSSAWNKWLVMYDKHLIDRSWWHAHQQISGFKTNLPRMEAQEKLEIAAQAKDRDKKPGPAPKSSPSRARRGKVGTRPAPPN